jgi:transketolase
MSSIIANHLAAASCINPVAVNTIDQTPAGECVNRDSVQRMKRRIVQASNRAGEGHVPSALSILDILSVLYGKVMQHRALAGQSPTDRDRFILSKGHGSLALYAVLAEHGYFPPVEFDRFCAYDGMLGGHPDGNKVPGVEASTGSLGHGLPMALGMALAYRIQQSQYRIFCLIGDGEANEGSIWEAALLGAHHQLSQLCCIVDFNHSTDRAMSLGKLTDKWRAFGWYATEVDGHDHSALEQALHTTVANQPLAVIAHTTKGKGVACMEGNPAWHHRAPNAAELEKILEELQ